MNIKLTLRTTFTTLCFTALLISLCSTLSAQEHRKTFVLEAGGGYSYYTFTKDDDEVLAGHNDQWRDALNYYAAIGYHFNEEWMLSFQFSTQNSYARTDDLYLITTRDTFFGYLEDNVRLLNFRAQIHRTIWNGDVFNVGYLLGVEFFDLRNTGRLIVDDYELTGKDLGFRIGFFGELESGSNLSLLLQIMYANNSVATPDYVVPAGRKINLAIGSQHLSHVSITAGLRYTFISQKKSPSPSKRDEEEERYVPKRFE